MKSAVCLMIWMMVLCCTPGLRADSTPNHFLQRLLEAGTGNEAVDSAAWDLLPRQVNMRKELEALQVNFLQQGERSACAAFSTTSMLELQLRRLGYHLDLSEQYLLWATQEEGATPSEGLTLEQLVNGLQKHGMSLEELMPYKSSVEIIAPSAAAKDYATRLPPVRTQLIVPFNGVPGFSEKDLYLICRSLARYEPVCLSSLWTKEGAKLGKNFVIQNKGVELKGGHMVLLTGYELTGEGEGYLLLRNSWGLHWGNFEYARMPFDYAREHGLDAVRFFFDWPGPSTESTDVAAPADAESNEQPEVAPPPPGLFTYLACMVGIYLGTGILAFGLPGLLWARDSKLPLRLLLFLLLLLPLQILLGILASKILVHYRWNEIVTVQLLLIGLVALLGICVRLAMRGFKVGFVRGGLILAVGLLIFWPVQLVAMHTLPLAVYQEWRQTFGSMPLHAQLRFAVLSKEAQADKLAESTRQPIPGGGSLDGELDWLTQWREDLIHEQRLLQPDQALAKAFLDQRIAQYNEHRQRFEDLKSAEKPLASQQGE